MVAKIFSSTLIGLDSRIIDVEVDVVSGLPNTIIVGLASTAVQESRERVRSAIKNSGFSYPLAKVSVNLAPAHLPKNGTRFDLPIALAILVASKQVMLKNKEKPILIGELSLDGSVRGVGGVVATVLEAKVRGINHVFVPAENWIEANLVKGLNIFPVSNLKELVGHFTGCLIKPSQPKNIISKYVYNKTDPSNFENIFGQVVAKRGLEIAAAGGHNICMVGPPGTGKTMLAKAVSTIMPKLSECEFLEVAKIYSASGVLPKNFLTRPFRAPHHTASYPAMIGGGEAAQPGEVTLAHNGILFLDELPEFSRNVLESLRQPLEDGEIILTRAHYKLKFPAKFLLVAAFNPCPCGFHNDGTNQCQCSALVIQKYQRKLSGPLLDRIDLRITVGRVPYEEMNNNFKTETSEIFRHRVLMAREKQYLRMGKGRVNANMTAEEIKSFCILDPSTEKTLSLATNHYNLSIRAVLRVLKVARTIADLADREKLQNSDVAESLHYRLGMLGQ